jgi:hypothetical protein
MVVSFHHIFALMIPLFGYLFGMIEMGIVTSESDISSKIFITQFFWPDIVYVNALFRFRFSPYVHMVALLLCALTIYKILQKKDIDMFL